MKDKIAIAAWVLGVFLIGLAAGYAWRSFHDICDSIRLKKAHQEELIKNLVFHAKDGYKFHYDNLVITPRKDGKLLMEVRQ